MRRSYFFLLDKLKITSAERKLMITLITALTLLSLASIILPDNKNAEIAEYAKLQQTFEHRSLQVHQDSVDKMARYRPGENTPEPQLPQQQEPKNKNKLKSERDERTATYAAVADNETSLSEEAKKNAADENKPEKIDLNSANRETLQMLPGIGPAYSKRIITYRKKNGPFKRPEELKNIKGIGPKTLEDILPLLDTTIFHEN